MKFKFPWHALLQSVGIAGTIANLAGSVFPQGSKGQVITGGIIAGIQAGAGLLAHFFNPDGTRVSSTPAPTAPMGTGGVGTINPVG